VSENLVGAFKLFVRRRLWRRLIADDTNRWTWTVEASVSLEFRGQRSNSLINARRLRIAKHMRYQ